MGNWEKPPGLGTAWLWDKGWRGPELWCKSAQLLKRKIFGGSLWDTHWLVNIFLAYQFVRHEI